MIKDNQTRVVVLILIVFLTLSYFYTDVGIGKSLQMQDAASLTQNDYDCTCQNLQGVPKKIVILGNMPITGHLRGLKIKVG